MKQKDIEGGFIGRTFMVYEQKDKRVNPLLDKPVHQLDIPHLAERLEKISKIKGEFIWSEKANSWYRDWYHKLKGQDTDDRTGSVNRLGDGVIKVAMLLSLADKDFLTIEKDNIMVAAQCCLQCTHSAIHMMPATTQQNGTNPTSIVIKAILSSTDFTISRQKLLSTVLRRVGGAAVLDKIIEPLISNGWIRLFRDDSKQPCYKLTDHGYLEFYQNNLTVEDTRL
jgi:hypothetical protein